jgi:hypothetical protein
MQYLPLTQLGTFAIFNLCDAQTIASRDGSSSLSRKTETCTPTTQVAGVFFAAS